MEHDRMSVHCILSGCDRRSRGNHVLNLALTLLISSFCSGLELSRPSQISGLLFYEISETNRKLTKYHMSNSAPLCLSSFICMHGGTRQRGLRDPGTHCADATGCRLDSCRLLEDLPFCIILYHSQKQHLVPPTKNHLRMSLHDCFIHLKLLKLPAF